MGNTSRKLAAKCTLLTKEEQKDVAATFRAASKNSDKIREEDLIVSGKLDAISLEKFWGPQIDPRLAQYLSNYLFGFGSDKASTVDFNRFAELYVYNVRGIVEERLEVTYNCLGMEYSSTTELPYQLLKEYCESIASTYIKIVKSTPLAHSSLWMDKGFVASAGPVQALGEAVAAVVMLDEDGPNTHCAPLELARWLQTNTLLIKLAEFVFTSLYHVGKRSPDEHGFAHVTPCASLLPRPEGLEAMPDYPAFTDLSHIVWINAQLPRKYQSKWRFLFSSHIHGESFSTLAGRIIDQGPSVIIIEDHNHGIFGGFAASSWCFGPTWTGSDEGFLFTLVPRMRLYPATQYNDHYQYFNAQTKTLPNGLLMGGQFEFGGIWLSAEPFGEGSSAESCSTYKGFKRLSKEPNFKIRSLEVWAVGDKPNLDRDSDERDISILDKSPDAKAYLEMTGRTQHSTGLRDPPPL